MKFFVFALFFVSTVSLAEDVRQKVDLPLAAQETLREEMRNNVLALNRILGLLAENKLAEAGEVAENQLGLSAMGKHRALPMEARPGAHMPDTMHNLGMSGHRAASAFASAAMAGERDKAMRLLPGLTDSCVACHFAYRIR